MTSSPLWFFYSYCNLHNQLTGYKFHNFFKFLYCYVEHQWVEIHNIDVKNSKKYVGFLLHKI
jgi:hypothetical protein